MHAMKSFRLFVKLATEEKEMIRFDAEADNINHAIEQAESAYPYCEVVSVNNTQDDPGIAKGIIRTSCNDYDVHEKSKSGTFWISVANASVWILLDESRLRIKVFGRGIEDLDCVTELGVDYADLRPTDDVFSMLNEEQQAAHMIYSQAVG
ncbi:MAG: hypothetical protein DDT25_00246 [Chloroflexi bacterium]|nr:hypothetical protein [Chloroflexota bacterium]